MMLAGFKSRCSTPRSCAARESRAELPRELEGLVLRQAADAAQQRREVLAVDVLHRQEVQPFDHRRCRRRGRRWDGRPGARCAPRCGTAPSAASLRCAGGKELERDRLVEGQIVGAVDLAHPALPEQAEDAVAAREHGAGGKAAFFRRAGSWCGCRAIEQRRAGRVRRQHRLDLAQQHGIADTGALDEHLPVARRLLERRLEDRRTRANRSGVSVLPCVTRSGCSRIRSPPQRTRYVCR